MINLLPPNRRLNIRLARSNTILRRYLELGVASLLLLVGAFFVTASFFNAQKNSIQKQLEVDKGKVEELAPIHAEAESLSLTVKTISALMAYNVQFSDLLVRIGGIMPDGSVLTGLQFSIENIDSPLVVTAEVDDEKKAAVLRNNLAASELFSRSEIKSIVKKEESTTSTATAPTTMQSNQQPSAQLPQTPATTDQTSNTTSTLVPSTSLTQPQQTTPVPATPEQTSPYKYTATINVYFKPEVLQKGVTP
jgi:hypothetical protein